MSLSSITISGTLRKDPEKRFTPTSIPVTNLILEVTFFPRGSQSGQEKSLSSQIIRVNAWRDLAEECEKKLKAGDKILISGRAQVNAYTTSEGKKKREIEIDATSITLLQDVLSIEPPDSQEQIEKAQTSPKKFSQDVEPIKNFEEVVSSTEEIPF
jgi:single stranded DNA-binding protein